ITLLALATLSTGLAWATPPAASAASLSARGSVEQVDVTGARAGARLVLIDRTGRQVVARRADFLGAALFRRVTPASGYRVRQGNVRSGAITVLPNRS